MTDEGESEEEGLLTGSGGVTFTLCPTMAYWLVTNGIFRIGGEETCTAERSGECLR